MIAKKLYFYIKFGILFLIHIFKKAIFTKEDNFEKFKQNYYPEFLTEVDKEDYKKIHLFEQCINCALCDSYCSHLLEMQRDGQTRLSSFFIFNSRNIANIRFSYEDLKMLNDCQNCTDTCEHICPNEYPITDLIKFMNKQNQKIIDEIISKSNNDE